MVKNESGEGEVAVKTPAISMQAHGVGARARGGALALFAIALATSAGPAMATVVAPAAGAAAVAASQTADASADAAAGVAIDPAAGPFVAPAAPESRARPLGAGPEFLEPDANPSHWISRRIKLRAAFAAAVADPGFRLLIGAGLCVIFLAAFVRRRRRRQLW